MVCVLQDNTNTDITVRLYCRKQEKVTELNEQHTLQSVAPGVTFKPTVTATVSVEECVKDADLVFLCIPAQTLSAFFTEHGQHLSPSSIIVNCAKGMAIAERKFICQIFAERYPDRQDKYTTLSGPSFADEIFKRMPTCVTIAGQDKKAIDL